MFLLRKGSAAILFLSLFVFSLLLWSPWASSPRKGEKTLLLARAKENPSVSVAPSQLGRRREPAPGRGQVRKGRKGDPGKAVGRGESQLFDVLTRKTFESVPALLEDLGFTRKELEAVRGDPQFFQKLGRLQKRTEHIYFSMGANLSGKGIWNLYLMDKNPKAFLDAKKMTFQDPKDKNRYLELVVFNGKKLGHKKVFIRIDAFPEMKRLREAQTHLVKRFTEDVRKRVRKFLKGKVPNVRKR